MPLNIVLIEPQIPQNTGNVARTCAATGSRLHLVGPMGFTVDDKKLKRAGLDYWYLLEITYYDDTADFFEKNNSSDMFFFTTKAEKSYDEAEYTDNSYIVFGREDAGISEALLAAHEGKCVRLPMTENARSLNLSNTVAVAAYEALRQNNFKNLQKESPRGF